MQQSGFIFSVLAGLLCLWISIVDFKTLKVPDLANVSVAALGVLAIYRLAPDLLGVHLLSALIVLAIAWGASEVAYRRMQRDVFGLGDVKLLADGTIWVGHKHAQLRIIHPRAVVVEPAFCVELAKMAERQAANVP